MADGDDRGRSRRANGRLPLAVVFGSMAAFWAVYLVLTTVRGYLIGLDFQDELLWRRLFVSIASFGVTTLMWLILRGFNRRRLAVRFAIALVVALPGSLLIAVINREAFRDLEARAMQKANAERGISVRSDDAGNLLVDMPDLPGEDPSPRTEAGKPDDPLVIDRQVQRGMMWLQLTDVALGRYFLLLAWAALYLAMTQAEKARLAERREGEYRRAAKAAELKSLRYQVNPHFLFNTLNSLSALVMTDRAEQAERMIQTISTFYRRSLAGDPSEDVALSEEIELQELYLQIEQVRFPQRLKIAISVPGELSGARIPGLILQPIVENSVKYAVAPSSRPVTVRIEAREEYERLVVIVSDDGPGRAEGNAGCGIGLDNVRSRLEARFGKEATLVSGDTGDGWRTVIRMPLDYSGPDRSHRAATDD